MPVRASASRTGRRGTRSWHPRTSTPRQATAVHRTGGLGTLTPAGLGERALVRLRGKRCRRRWADSRGFRPPANPGIRSRVRISLGERRPHFSDRAGRRAPARTAARPARMRYSWAPGVRRTSPEAEPRASPSPGRAARSLRSSALARPGASCTPPHPSPHLLRKTAVRPCGAASGGDPGPACPEPTPTESPRQRHVHPLSTCGPLLSPSPRDTGPSPHRAVQRHAR